MHIETGKSTKNLMASYLHNNGAKARRVSTNFLYFRAKGTGKAAPTNFYVAGDMA